MTSLFDRIIRKNRTEQIGFDESETRLTGIRGTRLTETRGTRLTENRLNDNLDYQEMQWYERNPLRFQREKNELDESYPDLSIQNLNDARICCSGSLKISDREIPIYIIFPYLYPLEPIKCYLDFDEQFNDIVSEDGSVTLFDIPNFSWDSRKTIKDVLDTLMNYFAIRIQLKNQEEQNEENIVKSNEELNK